MKTIITLLALMVIAPSGMADEHRTILTLEDESLRLQEDLHEYEKAVGKHQQLLAQVAEEDGRRLQDLREYEKTLQLQNEFLAQVREETREDELHQLQEAKKAFQQAQDQLRAEKHEMETRKRKHLDQLRTLKLLEMLDLDEDQELEFIHVFQSMRRKHRGLQHERQETIEGLSRALEEGNVTEEQITLTLSKIDELDSEDQAARRRFHDRASAILSPEQMGKLIVFHAKFEHEILNQLREFRGRGMERRQRGQLGELRQRGRKMGRSARR